MISEIRDNQQREVLVQKLGVFELRGLAREMGIPSPTTKKRDELISLILDTFKNGIQDPKIQKRGRPYKKLASLDEIINTVVENDNKSDLSYDRIISFAQETTPIVTTLGKDFVSIKGIAKKVNKSIVINSIDTSAKVFVDEVYCAEKLENGDYVTVIAQSINENNCFKALSIETINGVNAYCFERSSINHGEEIISDEKIELPRYEVVKGTRNAILLKNELYETKLLEEIVFYCHRTDSKLVLLGANISFENQILVKKLKLEFNFTTPYGSDPVINLNKVVDGLNLAENLFECGENVVIAVMDLGALLLALDENFEQSSEGHAQEVKVIARKLLSLAGAYANKRGITLISFYNEIDKDDKFLMGDLLRICRKA